MLFRSFSPWLLECVAGIIEEGESPEDVARRETVEEAGCEILDLFPVCHYLASPGGSSESIFVFCARVDASTAGGVFGLAEEHEDIRVRAIAAAQAELDLAELDLRYTKVRAPYAGIIVERLVEAGAYVQVGDPLVRMLGDRSLEIEADVPFRNLTGLAVNTKVSFTLDDGSRHSAVVRAMIPSENPLTRTRVVRFVPKFEETSRPLANDQSVTLQIPLGAKRQVLSVHKDAIVRRRGQNVVFVVNGDESQARPVDLGAAVGNRLEVLSGLEEGDRVVVRGNERLKQGDKVRIDGAS